MTHTLIDSLPELTMPEPMKIGHSYLRWSTPEQAKGDTFRRQTEERDRICRELGITLVEDYADRGKSGFKGPNKDLLRFLQDIKDRKIKPGQYLCLENIDRLSRQKPREAYNLFNQIIDAGIIILTTFDRTIYSKQTIDNQPGLMFQLWGTMQRANDESRVKSERISSSWRTRRANASTSTKKLSAIAPAWLIPARDNKGNIIYFDQHPDRLKVVKEIFGLASNGMGQWGIAKILNDRNEPVFSEKGGKWRAPYVGKIISSEAVLGHYVPKRLEDGKYVPCDRIEGYYGEAIIEEAVFRKANDIRINADATGVSRQRRGKVMANLFSKRCFCDQCNGPMLYKTYRGHTANGIRKPNRKYLHCENAKVGKGCNHKRGYNYDWFEETVLEHVNLFPLEQLFTDANSNRELGEIERKINEVTAKLHKEQKQQGKVKDLMREAETVEEARIWRADLNSTIAAIKVIEDDLLTLQRKKGDLEIAFRNSGTIKNTVIELRDRMAKADTGEQFVLRQKLSALLKTFVSQIRFDGQKDQFTVILHEDGLVNYLFQTSSPGGAPKRNPNRLVDVQDVRTMFEAPVDAGYRRAFTTDPKTGLHDPGREMVLDKLLAGGEPVRK